MCAADRPADYKLPEDVEYKMTDKEKRRLQRERDAERLAEEVLIKHSVSLKKGYERFLKFTFASANHEFKAGINL